MDGKSWISSFDNFVRQPKGIGKTTVMTKNNDDKDSETNCTNTRTDDFTSSLEGSTIDLKDDLGSN